MTAAEDNGPVPITDQVACIRRELALRERVYPGLVQRGRMRHEGAQLELRRMKAVLATLEACLSGFHPRTLDDDE